MPELINTLNQLLSGEDSCRRRMARLLRRYHDAHATERVLRRIGLLDD